MEYLQAVHDYKDGEGIWRQKVLGSFGRADDPENYAKALQFVASAEAFRRAAEKWKHKWDDLEPLEKAFVAVLGGAAIAWLLSSR